MSNAITVYDGVINISCHFLRDNWSAMSGREVSDEAGCESMRLLGCDTGLQ